MKLLIKTINYPPEQISTGKYAGEMAEWFASNGHSVRVITTPPYYPAWQISEGYQAHRYRKDKIKNVDVYRVPLWVPRQPSGLKRMFHLFSFALSSLPVLFAQWRWKPDVVCLIEPPFMCAPAVIAFSKLTGTCSWLHVQDYEIDAAFDLGLIKGNALRSLVQSVERLLMRRFDRVSSISGRMVERAITKGVRREKVVHFPNWVDISHISPLTSPSTYRDELGVRPDAIVALYSGNMGNKQGLEILADVARLLQDEPNIQFVFAGNGSGRNDLQARCAGLCNVHFLGLQPSERLNDWLGLADVHLLPQRADAADLVMPSKLTGMMASGKAVLATAHEHTELGRVVTELAGCGMVVPPEDPDALANALRTLGNNPQLRSELGAKGRIYAERELSRSVILGRFEAQLMALVKQSKSA